MSHLLSDEIMGIIEYHLADCDPAMYLASVKSHFGDVSPERDQGDGDGYKLLSDVQECIWSGLTTLCLRCRQMEGMHSGAHAYCPKGDWYSVSETFYSMEMSYRDALGGFPDVNTKIAYRMGDI